MGPPCAQHGEQALEKDQHKFQAEGDVQGPHSSFQVSEELFAGPFVASANPTETHWCLGQHRAEAAVTGQALGKNASGIHHK